jgi:hypothetical protein
MQAPQLNGVQKPADVIARGPHKYNEATRKYEEIPFSVSEYPRAMWHHEKRLYQEAHSKAEQDAMQAEGWQTKPFAEQVAQKETVTAAPADLALIVLQQQQTMNAMQEKLAQMEKERPTTAPAIPEHRGPGRPPKIQEG